MNAGAFAELDDILARVRRRYRTLTALRAIARAATAAALVLSAALLAQWTLAPAGAALVALWFSAVAAAAVAGAAILLPLRRRPGDRQIARYIEERCPGLEDALATAVSERDRHGDWPFVAQVVMDALSRARVIDPERVIDRRTLRIAAAAGGAAVAVLAVLAILAGGPVAGAGRLLALYLFPGRLVLDVTPGDVSVRAGESVRITARVSGQDGVAPLLRRSGGERWHELPMEQEGGAWVARFDDVRDGFRYAVAAAGVVSPEFTVTVLRPPGVERIDLRYEYPLELGLEPRIEEDGGDIYAPPGTRVHLTVHADEPVASGELRMSDGAAVPLTAGAGPRAAATLTVAADGSYRVRLTDDDGLSSPGDTEYFIRTVRDRPPDVRILRPAGDRQVTPIEEVAVEARADDDHGIAAFDLVYSIRGGEEIVVPFPRGAGGTIVEGELTLYLEELGLNPGDFVAYYARARDVSRGAPSTEARSDIYFLEVRPFESEFTAARSQGSGGGGGDDQPLEELVDAQKAVITATWTLDRRGRRADGRSVEDIQAVADAQLEIRRRTAAAAGRSQRAEDIRRLLRGVGSGDAAAGTPMTRALAAMDAAHLNLSTLDISSALPNEMTALNELLRAQAEIRRREVRRERADGGGRGSGRQSQDLSSLFDRELARQQQTNYETPGGASDRGNESAGDVLERLRELARRQESLNRARDEVARSRSIEEEDRRRQLERLAREQAELRQQVEALAQQLQQQGEPQNASGGEGSAGRADARDAPARGAGDALRQVAEDMRRAAAGLRNGGGRDGQGGRRALDRLRELEEQMRRASPDERRRALGDLRLETLQLAEAQRRLAAPADFGQTSDAARRRAGEQQRLAERMQRVEEALKELGAAPARSAGERAALEAVLARLEEERLSQRMREAAQAAAGAPSPPGDPGEGRQAEGGHEEAIARALDDLADRLLPLTRESQEARQLAEDLLRVRSLRDRLADVDRRVAELRRGDVGSSERAPGGTDAAAEGREGRGQSGTTSGAWQEARQLLEALRREQDSGLASPDLQSFNPGRSAPGTEPWKQDFRRWDELKTQIAAALDRLETAAEARLRAQQAQGRLNAGAAQAVPEEYRSLVDRYYRALASSPAR